MQQNIVLNGRKFSYSESGKGPVVMLVHGFGEDSLIWSSQTEALPGFRLILPDLPGSGGSDMIADMSMEGMAAILHELLEQLGIKKCTMIGHSMGGYVTLAFAEKWSDQLSGFGLFHSTAFADSIEKKEVRKKGIDFIERNGPFEFLKTSIPGLFSPASRENRKELIEELLKRAHNFSGAALVSYYRSMMERPDRTSVLKMSQVPVLFILGRHDQAVPLEDGLKLCHLPGLSYIHILEESGHMGMKEEPHTSNKVLSNYLTAIHHQPQ